MSLGSSCVLAGVRFRDEEVFFSYAKTSHSCPEGIYLTEKTYVDATNTNCGLTVQFAARK